MDNSPSFRQFQFFGHLGFIGMTRWVGLGVIADNLINIGRAMEMKSRP